MLVRPCWRLLLLVELLTPLNVNESRFKQHLAARSLPSFLSSHIFLTSGVGGMGGVGDRRLGVIGGVQGYYAAAPVESEWLAPCCSLALLVFLLVRQRACVHWHAGVMC